MPWAEFPEASTEIHCPRLLHAGSRWKFLTAHLKWGLFSSQIMAEKVSLKWGENRNIISGRLHLCPLFQLAFVHLWLSTAHSTVGVNRSLLNSGRFHSLHHFCLFFLRFIYFYLKGRAAERVK